MSFPRTLPRSIAIAVALSATGLAMAPTTTATGATSTTIVSASTGNKLAALTFAYKLAISEKTESAFVAFDAAVAAGDATKAKASLTAVADILDRRAKSLRALRAEPPYRAAIDEIATGPAAEATAYRSAVAKSTTAKALGEAEVAARETVRKAYLDTERATRFMYTTFAIEPLIPIGEKPPTTPVAKVVLEDTFDRVDKRRWYLDDATVTPMLSIAKGEAVLKAAPGRANIVTIDREPDPLGTGIDRISLEADVIVTRDGLTLSGVICRQAAGGVGGYWGGIGADGVVVLAEVGVGPLMTERLFPIAAAVRTTPGATNRVRLDCDGKAGEAVSLRLYVNDTLVGQVQDTQEPHAPGAYGIYSEATVDKRNPPTTPTRFLRFRASRR